jgi:hypothetical protein
MKVTIIHYSRTYQVRQYEPEKIEVTYELEDGDDPVEALKQAKELVHSQRTNR